MIGISRRLQLPSVLLLAACSCPMLLRAQADELPQNIGGNLRRLIQAKSTLAPNVNLNAVHLAINSATNKYELLPGSRNLEADAQNRVLVRIVLDGSGSLVAAQAAITRLGGRVVASSSFARGLIGAYIPVENAAALAQTPGVQSVHLTLKPQKNVGAVTAQSVPAQNADAVQAMGITGRGVTVGVMSDSFNTSTSPITAADDVASGDLPRNSPTGIGLKALLEDSANGTDEGRAMTQIVHDLAPSAQICFATADGGEVNFAANILKLANESGPCNANVIVDDLTYFGEPFFSDGIISDAIRSVSISPKRDGSRVTYLSSAGNDQLEGYAADFNSVSAKLAAKQPQTQVDLSSIPKSIDISGGLHNFGTANDIEVAQQLIVLSNPLLVLQWDDPFDLGKISTDYSLLLFDQNGNFIKASDTDSNASSADNAFVTDEPIQSIAFDTTATNGVAVYYLVIARSGQGTHQAKRLKYIASGGTVIAPYNYYYTPTLYGHHGAKYNIAVAAYEANRPGFSPHRPFYPELEDFTSPGPFLNVFDENGDRLPTPETRLKPDVSCTDGLFTTFFGQFIRNDDQFPRFYGTSAAAPCAAGIAALMLDKASHSKNPVNLKFADVLDAMQHGVAKHDLDPYFAQGTSYFADGGYVTVRIHGNNNNISDPSDFRVDLKNVGGSWALTKLTLQSQPVNNLLFFETPTFPFLTGPASPGVTATLLSPVPPAGQTLAESTQMQIGFTGLTSGKFAEFDVDRAEPAFGYIDDDADRLGTTTYTAELVDKRDEKVTVNGTIYNRDGAGWNLFDGYGLVDAERAVANVP